MPNENPNGLSDLHEIFTKTPVFFRERMCEECNWSTPTFYRKMRLVNDLTKGAAALSNAEKTMMKKVAAEVKVWLQNSLVQLIGS